MNRFASCSKDLCSDDRSPVPVVQYRQRVILLSKLSGAVALGTTDDPKRHQEKRKGTETGENERLKAAFLLHHINNPFEHRVLFVSQQHEKLFYKSFKTALSKSLYKIGN